MKDQIIKNIENENRKNERDLKVLNAIIRLPRMTYFF